MNNSLSNESVLDTASRWLRNAWARYASEPALRSDSDAEQIAHDLNMSVSELQAICARDRGSPELLRQRMAQLHLDREAIKRAYPAVVRDMEKTCALCAVEAKCSRDFKRNADPKGWTDYCPNAPTLQDLQADARGPAA